MLSRQPVAVPEQASSFKSFAPASKQHERVGQAAAFAVTRSMALDQYIHICWYKMAQCTLPAAVIQSLASCQGVQDD